MSSIPQRLYNRVMMADDFTCVYCGTRTPDVQIDHIIPRNYSGPDVLHNLVAACPKCNSRKRDHQLHEVGMRLLYGRFGQEPSRSVDPIVPPQANAAPQKISRYPRFSVPEREQRIRELVRERNKDGSRRFSANAICKIIGGTRADVLERVRKTKETTDTSN